MSQEDKVMDRVGKYFESRYKGLEHERMLPFDQFCLGKGMEAEEQKYSCQLERAKELGLTYEEWEFDLDFLEVHVWFNRAWVKVREQHRVVFKLTRGTTSTMRGLIHTLMMTRSSDNWYITSHRYKDETSRVNKTRPFALKPGPYWGCSLAQGNRKPVLRLYEYNRKAAVEYAHMWALDRNPKYYDFENLGGDCTNFCSQVLHSGGCPMNNAKTNGWYYYSLNNRSPSWTGVEFFYRFVINNRGMGPRVKEVSPSQIELGDLIQLDLSSDLAFNHCLVVVANPQSGDIGKILISCHTTDRDNYPLMFYNWRGIRYLHIMGYGQ